MSGVGGEAFLAAVISGAILAGLPLLLAGLGETFGEQAGVLGIGMEGYMLFGAYAGFVGAYYSASPWLGLLCGVVAGALAAGLVAVLSVYLGLNQIVVGIGVILLGQGVTSALHAAQFGSSYPRLAEMAGLPIPLLSKIPVLGGSLFSQPLIFWISLVLLAVAWWLLRSTGWGLAVRAAGEKPEALEAAGGDVLRTRTAAVLVSGSLAGLGGAYLSVVAAGVFVPFMTNGSGFIAIVIAMLARGRAGWVGIAAFLFGLCVSLATALQLVGVEVPTDAVYMIPFLAVMVALVAFARRSYLPSALCVPYRRRSR
ncbi:MAG: ABC transporter permease [Thermoleophilia bacterium]|nr:ABC transporter permease [Thermoleophilia bacterium]